MSPRTCVIFPQFVVKVALWKVYSVSSSGIAPSLFMLRCFLLIGATLKKKQTGKRSWNNFILVAKVDFVRR